MTEKPSQLIDRQDAIDKIRLTRDIAEQRRIEIENNSELSEEERQEELEKIRRETEAIEADIKRQAEDLSKDDTFLNWVRKKFSKGVLVIAVLKTMAGISASAEAGESPVIDHDGSAEIQPGGSDSSGSSDIYQEGGLFDDRDTYQFDKPRDYSRDYHVGAGELDFSEEAEPINDMIKNFCEQRGIQPWDVKVSAHLISNSSIEGDSDANYDLAGEGALQAQQTFPSEKINVNPDNLQITAENLGEVSVVDGKVLSETEARQAISQELGIDESKIDRLIHSYNHGGKLTAEEKRIMDKYIGDSRGVRMIVELEDISQRDGVTEHVSDGFTEHVPSDTRVVYGLVVQDPTLVTDSAIIPDRQKTTEEIYKTKSRKKYWKRFGGRSPFRIGPREIPSEAEIPPASPDESTPLDTVPDKSKSEVIVGPDSRTNDRSDGGVDKENKPNVGGGDKISVEPTPDSISDVDPGDENDERDRRGRGENGRIDRGGKNIDIIDADDQGDSGSGDGGDIDIVDPPIVDPPIVDPDRNFGIDRQQSPNIQATRRRGSDGPSRRENKESVEDWNKFKNKGDKPRSVGEGIKLGRRTGMKAGQIDRTETRRFVRGKKEGLKKPVLNDENYN